MYKREKRLKAWSRVCKKCSKRFNSATRYGKVCPWCDTSRRERKEIKIVNGQIIYKKIKPEDMNVIKTHWTNNGENRIDGREKQNGKN